MRVEPRSPFGGAWRGGRSVAVVGMIVASVAVIAAIATLWGIGSVAGSGRSAVKHPVSVGAAEKPFEPGRALAPVADLTGAPSPVVVAELPDRPRVARSQVVTDGSRRGKMVALTFDDNYAPESAVPIVDGLERAGAPATLFLVGGATRATPEVTERIAGNPLLEVGDHSGSHVDLTLVGRSTLQAEIGAGIEAYREMTGGHTSRLFRAPGGHVDAEVLEVAADEGFPYTVAFDPGPADYEGIPAATIVEEVRRRTARAGGIVLLHFNAAHTAEALPDLVFSLRARGYRLVTVSELLRGDRLWFDVDPADPAYPSVLALSRAGLMRGFPTGDYGAYEPMSRVDLSVVLARCLGEGSTVPAALESETAPGSGSGGFADVLPGRPGLLAGRHGFSTEEVAAVARVTQLGLMQGGRDAAGRPVFWPLASVRRVDLALAVARAAEAWLPRPVTSGGGDAPADPPLAPGAEAAMRAVVDAGFMDPRGDALAPWEPVGRAEVAVVVHRLVQVVAPDLVGQRTPPAWYVSSAAGR